MQVQYLVLFCLYVTAMADVQPDIDPIKPKVVVLSLGALRLEWIQMYMDGVQKLLKKTTHARYLLPVMPSKGPVNHLSIATGLYADGHGVINDCEYDEANDEPNHDANKPKKNPCISPNLTIKPLWIENQEAGGLSGVMNWPGAEKLYNKQQSTYYANFDDDPKKDRKKQINDRILIIMQWLTYTKNPANLVMVYYGELDKILHKSSAQLPAGINELKLCQYFIETLILNIELHVPDVNLIVLGSHAGITVYAEDGIDLNTILKDQNVSRVDAMGAIAIVTPNEGQLDNVYNILHEDAKTTEKYKVYYQQDTLNIWHLRGMPLFENKIFLVANVCHFFWNKYLIRIKDKQKEFEATIDGYWNFNNGDLMYLKTFFMAKGPKFVPGKEVPPFNTIDVYPLLRKLLELPEKENVKLSDVVNQMLKPEEPGIIADSELLKVQSKKKEPGIIPENDLLKVKSKKKGPGFIKKIFGGATIFTQSVKGSNFKRKPKV